jgi:hypothetical protein
MWECRWYFCMKLWVVNDIDTNYQIPLILTSFSKLSNAFHSLDMFFKFISHKGIMIFYFLNIPP